MNETPRSETPSEGVDAEINAATAQEAAAPPRSAATVSHVDQTDSDVAAVSGDPQCAPQPSSDVANDDGAPIERLADQLLSRAQGIDALCVHQLSPTSLLLFCKTGRLTAKARIRVGYDLIRQASLAGFAAQPLLLPDEQWRSAKLPDAAGQIALRIASEQAARHWLSDYRGRQPFPKASRALLMSSLGHWREVTNTLTHGGQFPPHITLTLCNCALTESLRLLFATQDLPFDGDIQSLTHFDEEFSRSGYFDVDGLLPYLHLQGLTKEATYRFVDTLSDEDDALGWREALADADKLMRSIERYVRDRYTTDAERATLRRKRRLGITAAAATIALLLGVALWPKPSLKAITDQSLISKPGAIAAEYFRGTDLKQKVTSRIEPGIALRTMVSPLPGLPADRWSARWKGFLFFPQPGDWQICSESDDGSRVYLNNTLMVDNWGLHATRRKCHELRVERGWYPLRVEFFDQASLANMRVLVGRDEKHVHLVPKQHLCCGK